MPISGVSSNLAKNFLIDDSRTLKSGPETVNCIASPRVPEAKAKLDGNALIPGIAFSSSRIIGIISYCFNFLISLGFNLT